MLGTSLLDMLVLVGDTLMALVKPKMAARAAEAKVILMLV